MIQKFKYEVNIEIDEVEVFDKYPNYIWNYETPEELADSIGIGITIEADTDMSKDGMESWGYSINSKKINPNSFIYEFKDKDKVEFKKKYKNVDFDKMAIILENIITKYFKSEYFDDNISY